MENNSYSNTQSKSNCSRSDLRRNSESLQVSTQLLDSSAQNITTLLLPSSQGSSGNPLLGYQGTSFGGLYASPGFNTSLASYENNLQWLADSRIQSQHNQLSAPGSLMTEKSVVTSAHSLPATTSHSCCVVNRLGMLDSLSMSSMCNDQVKPTCDVTGFQNKSSLTMNMIDPLQSWLNFQIPNNQQYCKYGERPVNQNFSIPASVPSQMALPLIDQSDLKQNGMCTGIQSPDTCFENLNSNNNSLRHTDSSLILKQNSFPVDNKQAVSQENATILKHQNSYQANLISKDWKPTLQTMQNYNFSPNMFGTVGETQDNFLFSQYNVPSVNSFYPSSENYSTYCGKNNSIIGSCNTQVKTSQSETRTQNTYGNENQRKVYHNQKVDNNTSNQFVSEHVKEIPNISQSLRSCGPSKPLNFNLTLNDCCQVKKSQVNTLNLVDNRFILDNCIQEDRNNVIPKSLPLEVQHNNRSFKSPEGVLSESDESNIIVEESDDIGEVESEISIEDIKKGYKATETYSNEVLLRCLVCNVATSPQVPANHFIHMNKSFPLTASLKIPVHLKLEQIIPVDLQHYLKMNNSFVCRRCLNLIETVELLEVKLTTAKQTINDNFYKTVQQNLPEVVLSKDKNSISKACSTEELNKSNESMMELEVENICPGDAQALNESENSNKELQCSYCKKILHSQKTFNLHICQHSKEFNYYCELCGKGFPLKYSLERHLNWHSGSSQEKLLLCEICGALFSSKHLFYSHQLKVHNGDCNFRCGTCGKGFTRKVSLEIHSLKHTGVRSFICKCCGHLFTSESNLKSHLKICTKDPPYKCEDCGNSFASDGQLTKHKTQHNIVFKLKCEVCDKGFNNPAHLRYHMLSHSSEKRFKCCDCEKAFKTSYNLNYHSRVVHKKEKVFNCTVCGKVFGQKTLLSDHMKSHTKERPYKCAQCEKRFVHQTTFITHLKSHTGKVKLKTCQVCGKGIKTRMSVHMRTHTGERPYKCHHCPLAFCVGISLRRHIQLKHCNLQ